MHINFQNGTMPLLISHLFCLIKLVLSTLFYSVESVYEKVHGKETLQLKVENQSGDL